MRTKFHHPFFRLLVFTALAFALFACFADHLRAADAAPPPPQPNFRYGLSLDTFVAATAKDLTGEVDYGGGLGANYFFTRGFGAGVRVIAWDTTDRFVDEIDARLIARAPLWDRVAPYGYVEGTYNVRRGLFRDGAWGAGAGGGLEIALSPHFALKAEAGLRVGTDGVGAFVGTAGISVPF